jgi:hypothetical protein
MSIQKVMLTVSNCAVAWLFDLVSDKVWLLSDDVAATVLCDKC